MNTDKNNLYWELVADIRDLSAVVCDMARKFESCAGHGTPIEHTDIKGWHYNFITAARIMDRAAARLAPSPPQQQDRVQP